MHAKSNEKMKKCVTSIVILVTSCACNVEVKAFSPTTITFQRRHYFEFQTERHRHDGKGIRSNCNYSGHQVRVGSVPSPLDVRISSHDNDVVSTTTNNNNQNKIHKASTSSSSSSSSAFPSSPSAAFGRPLSKSTTTFNRAAIGFVKNTLFDIFFSGTNRAYARFYALETIARVPYFSYLSVLHLYETLGWWRRADYLKIHFAESWNELHHLLIMEELGGNDLFVDRFVAQHVAFFYYWFVVGAYMFNPTLAYNLNQAVEEHAYETYDEFLKQNEDMLRALPAPDVAKEYYRDGDLYMFDEMHSNGDALIGVESSTSFVGGKDGKTVLNGGGGGGKRRPKCDTLYDVFIAIRDDEAEHVRTMAYLQREDADLRRGKEEEEASGVANGIDKGDEKLDSTESVKEETCISSSG